MRNLGIKKGLNAALLATLAAVSGGLSAAPTQYHFTATNFTAINGTSTSPAVFGSFTLDGTTITQIDLTLGTHTYTLDEVELVDPDSIIPMLGGRLNNANSVAWGTNDFWLRYWSTGEFFEFAYTTDAAVEFFTTNTGTMTVSSVPVPAAAWLFGSGLIGLAGVARRRK